MQSDQILKLIVFKIDVIFFEIKCLFGLVSETTEAEVDCGVIIDFFFPEFPQDRDISTFTCTR